MPTKLPESESLILLAKRRRRILLRILSESSTPLSIEELAERIGERESEDLTTNQHDSIRISLYHNHIPRLEEAEVILYDEEADTVAPYQNFDSLVHVLESMTAEDLPWSSD